MERRSAVRLRRPRRQAGSLGSRLAAIRSYMRSIHAACLNLDEPQDGHVLLVEPADGTEELPAGGYGLVAHHGRHALLNSIRLSKRGELEYGDRILRVPYACLSPDMIVGWETMIIPEPSRDSSLRSE